MPPQPRSLRWEVVSLMQERATAHRYPSHGISGILAPAPRRTNKAYRCSPAPPACSTETAHTEPGNLFVLATSGTSCPPAS